MGRPKGAKNKTDEARAFVAAVERALAKSGATDTLVNLVCRHLTSEKPACSVPALTRVLEMKFGKPVQPNEHTGKDGQDLKIIIEHITA